MRKGQVSVFSALNATTFFALCLSLFCVFCQFIFLRSIIVCIGISL